MEKTLLYLDILKSVISCLAFIAFITAAIQIRIAKRNLAFNSFKSIYDDNIKIRKKFKSATEQRIEIMEIISKSEIAEVDLTELYGEERYNELREVGYHYEYIGILIQKKIISMNVVFDLILFPDKFWKESNQFIEVMRKQYYPDFWLNFEKLKNMYEMKRLKNNKLST